ncbi:hypothetical protein Aduo_014259 [Ancylostoma duodenale]
MSHFVLALEMEAYQDDPFELELLVDNRIRTKDRVLFIQQCLYKYYEIPSHLREGTWRKAKESLNGRVRRLRKTLRDQELARSRNQSRRLESQERRPMQQRENNYRSNQESYYFDDE